MPAKDPGGLPWLPGPGWGQKAGAPKNISGLEAGSSATAPVTNQRPYVPPTALGGHQASTHEAHPSRHLGPGRLPPGASSRSLRSVSGVIHRFDYFFPWRAAHLMHPRKGRGEAQGQSHPQQYPQSLSPSFRQGGEGTGLPGSCVLQAEACAQARQVPKRPCPWPPTPTFPRRKPLS